MQTSTRPKFWPVWPLLCLAAAPLPAQNAAPPLPPPAGQAQAVPRTLTPPPRPQPFRRVIAPKEPYLAFDAETKRYDAAPGESVAPFTFDVTNIWTNEVVIHRAQGSCSCATAQLPETPWHLAPGASGRFQAKVSMSDKMGLSTKAITLFLSAGTNTNTLTHVVNLEVNVPTPEDRRQMAIAKAKIDPHAIFKGDCAVCHSAKGQNTFGEALYAADCGICHESSHRNSAVPDLHAHKQATGYEYWERTITLGKAHTMMPGFAQGQGGPLSAAQIDSLAAYLNRTISHHLSSSNSVAASVPLSASPQ
jgi:mono/diheme cytochrome c family protein